LPTQGASLVRMLHAVLGQEDFRKGLQVYMHRHAYSNTETFDLWNAWESVSGTPPLWL
jgi:aminopeptidase N